MKAGGLERGLARLRGVYRKEAVLPAVKAPPVLVQNSEHQFSCDCGVRSAPPPPPPPLVVAAAAAAAADWGTEDIVAPGGAPALWAS